MPSGTACLVDQTRARLLAGQLAGDELVLVEGHLDACPVCRQQVVRLVRAKTDGDSTGRVVGGRYRLVRKLGSGGMGAVYEARHLELSRRVAIKVLHPQFAERPEILSRFKNEARILANLEHDAIVAAHDFGVTAEGEPFLVLDFLEGQTLRDRIVQSSLGVREAIVFAREVADALQAAHSAGVVHLDIKPENIFVTSAGQTKVLDFGVSRPIGETVVELDAIVVEQVVGTLRYMAPEQISEPDSVDARTDVFALGLLLFELLAGEYAIAGQTKEDLILNVRGGRVRDLAALRPDLPASAVALVTRAVAILPEKRFPSALEFSRAAERALADHLLPRLEERSLRPPVEASVSGKVPFVGRVRELTAVAQMLQESMDTQARLVAVVGASGLGKSALLDKACAHAVETGWQTAVLRAAPGARKGTALVSLANAFGLNVDELVEEAKSWLAPFERSTLEKFVTSLSGTDEAQSLNEAALRVASDHVAAGALTFTEILLDEASRAAEQGAGLAIFVDDWAELDELSSSVLRQCVWRASERWTLCLVVTTSSTEVATKLAPNQLLALEPFTEDETRQLVATFERAPHGTAETLHARSGGHPAFVAWSLLTLHHPVSDSESNPLLGIVHARLEALSPKSREACKTLSAWDGPFSGSLLESLGFVGIESIWAELDEQRWLRGVGSDSAVFREPLAKDLVYQLLRPAARVDLHRRMAELLCSMSNEQERAAIHFEKADSRERAAALYTGALRDGASQGDLSLIVRAGDGVARVGSLAALEPQHLELYCGGLSFAGRLDDEADALQILLGLPLEGSHDAVVRVAAAVCAWRRGHAEQSRQLSEAALGVAREQSDSAVLARVLGRHAMIVLYNGASEEARQILVEAADLIEGDAESGLGLSAELAAWQGQLAASLGAVEARKAAYEKAAVLFEERGDVRSAAGAAVNLADTLNRLGLYMQAERALSNASGRCRSVGASLMEAYAELNAGYSRIQLGRYPKAHDALNKSRVLAERMQEQRLLSYIEIYRAECLWREGRLAEGRVAATAGVERSAAYAGIQAHAWLVLALCAKDDDISAALHAVEQAAGIRNAAQGLEEADALYWFARGEVLQLAGRTGEAKEAWSAGRAYVDSVAATISAAPLRAAFVANHIHKLLVLRTGGLVLSAEKGPSA